MVKDFVLISNVYFIRAPIDVDSLARMRFVILYTCVRSLKPMNTIDPFASTSS